MNILYLKQIATKKNIKYVAAEVGGALLGYTAATYTNLYVTGMELFVQGVDISDEVSVAATIFAQGFTFIGGNLAIHKLLHQYSGNGENFRDDLTKLVRSQFQGLGISGILKTVSHYALLKTGLVPLVWAPIAAYALPGWIGGGYRHVRNYNNGFIDFPTATNRKSNQTLEEIAR